MTKFAVTRTKGDDIEVLKEFGDDKDAAMAYGKEVAKESKGVNICCVKGYFNEKNQMDVNARRIYKVWQC